MADSPAPDPSSPAAPHRRRPRYGGKNPRRFEEKYKEHDPARYPDTVAKVLAAGQTPAGSHRPIMVREVLHVLSPEPGEIAVDCTLGYGGHASEIIPRLQPRGRLLGLDADPFELPKTEMRLRGLGFGLDILTVHRSNFAGLPRILAQSGLKGVDIILADLGVSSMQLDDPARGFSLKQEGPLDMRINPQRGQPASALIEKSSPDEIATLLAENADEPTAESLGAALARKTFTTTSALTSAIRQVLRNVSEDERDLAVRRVFQALRIAVNDESSALEMLLRHLPDCLNPGGRAAILTFHSGEDRRVKKAFQAGRRDGRYTSVAEEVIRASPEEWRANPRSASAKLRWAIRGRGD